MPDVNDFAEFERLAGEILSNKKPELPLAIGTPRPAQPRTDGLRLRPGDQPLPTGGQEDVQARLIKEIQARRELGISRYGQGLKTFNGRKALRDLLDELLDGASYAMQAEMEWAATQFRIANALNQHYADASGLCQTCKVASPCETRRILTGVREQPKTPSIIKVEPIEEIAVSPDAVGWLRENLGVSEEKTGLPTITNLMGFPVFVDDELPPGTVRLQPSTGREEGS